MDIWLCVDASPSAEVCVLTWFADCVVAPLVSESDAEVDALADVLAENVVSWANTDVDAIPKASAIAVFNFFIRLSPFFIKDTEITIEEQFLFRTEFDFLKELKKPCKNSNADQLRI